MPAPENRNLGTQPIDGLMDELGLDNHALVEAAGPGSGLSHKAVARARKGRWLTPKTKAKVIAAFAKAAAAKADGDEDDPAPPPPADALFNY